jgi:RimJ/RimL family protein N-acetyltransferase
LTGSEPLTYEEELENHKSWLTDPKKYTFLVFAKDNNKLIGDVNLFFSDWIEPNEAEINIMIAVKEYRGKGLAK